MMAKVAIYNIFFKADHIMYPAGNEESIIETERTNEVITEEKLSHDDDSGCCSMFCVCFRRKPSRKKRSGMRTKSPNIYEDLKLYDTDLS